MDSIVSDCIEEASKEINESTSPDYFVQNVIDKIERRLSEVDRNPGEWENEVINFVLSRAEIINKEIKIKIKDSILNENLITIADLKKDKENYFTFYYLAREVRGKNKPEIFQAIRELCYPLCNIKDDDLTNFIINHLYSSSIEEFIEGFKRTIESSGVSINKIRMDFAHKSLPIELKYPCTNGNCTVRVALNVYSQIIDRLREELHEINGKKFDVILSAPLKDDAEGLGIDKGRLIYHTKNLFISGNAGILAGMLGLRIIIDSANYFK